MFECFDTVQAVLQVTTGVMSTLKVSVWPFSLGGRGITQKNKGNIRKVLQFVT